MRVLLVVPPSPSNIKSVLGTTSPPLGLAYLAAAAREAGHDIKIVDSLAEDLTLGKLKRIISSFDPDVIGITATTTMIYDAYSVARVAKTVNPNVTVVVGGPHATFVPLTTLRECPYVDVVVRGEGEETFRELLNVLERGGDLSEVRGITYRTVRGAKSTPPRPLVRDIDSLPMPAYDLLPMHLYRFNGERYGTVITSRGCPFGCIFCASSALFGRTWRGHSVERVIAELKVLREEYGIREIEFIDDSFTLNKRRTVEIAKAIIREGLDISWSFSSRVDTFNREIALLAKKSGAHTVYFGIESASVSTLRFIRKGITPRQSERSVKTAKAVGLEVLGSFMIGFPYESEMDMIKTIGFASKLGVDYAQFSIATPYPGTLLWRIALAKNLLLTRNWRLYTAVNAVMKNLYVPAKTVERLLRWAYVAFYLSPRRVIKDLAYRGGALTIRALRSIPRVIARLL